MSCFIVNDDRFEIKQFKNIVWFKKTNIYELPSELQEVTEINENIKLNNAWYFSESSDYILCAFLANIAVNPHPLIELAYVCNWYNSNYGGVYVIGKDKKTGALFAPVMN